MTVTEKYLTDIGYSTFLKDNAWHCSFSNDDPNWWLEEVELPSEDEIEEMATNYATDTSENVINSVRFEQFTRIFNKAIKLIKGEGLNNPTTN